MQAKAPNKVKPKGKPGRPASVDIYPGKYFGYLVIKGKVNTKEGLRWRVECTAPLEGGVKCGKVFKTKTAYLTRQPNPQTNCGCQTYKGANKFPREKGIWHMMHMRTENPNHVSFAHYGGRGIKVCAEWNKTNPQGFENFIAFIGGAPTTKHSIDRVNPNLGYQPYQEDGVTPQVRWATAKQQANNQRKDWPKP